MPARASPPVGQAPRAGADRAGRQEQADAAAAHRAAADRDARVLGAAHRGAWLRPRGVRALPARARPARRLTLRHARREQPARGRCGKPALRPGRGRRSAIRGCWSRSRDGTLFIQEIEDLPPVAQRMLVGALESGRFSPPGGAGAARAARAHRLLRAARRGEPRRRRRVCAATCWPISTRSSSGCRRCATTPRMSRSCCANRWTASSTPRGCRSAASASRRRTGCATIPGPTTCGN